jgi:hypothetical protein
VTAAALLYNKVTSFGQKAEGRAMTFQEQIRSFSLVANERPIAGVKTIMLVFGVPLNFLSIAAMH